MRLSLRRQSRQINELHKLMWQQSEIEASAKKSDLKRGHMRALENGENRKARKSSM